MNKTAIVSDVLMEYGGAERVVEVLLEMWPEADIYTLFIVPAARRKILEKYPNRKIYTSRFQYLIFSDRVSKYISAIKLFSWIYWELLDLSNYDLVISSSHSFGSKAVKTKGLHLSYVHTPPRYLYDELNEIGFVKWKIFWPIRKILQMIDRRGSIRPMLMAANSENVARRIKKYYGREAVVVYPPTEISDQLTVNSEQYKNKNKEYFVWVSRLVRQKGAELAVRTAVKNGWNLKLIGNGPELINLKKLANEKIEFYENCGDEEKYRLMAGARALLYTSIEEDFGMVPVESLLLGVPIVAYNSGGVKEVVVEGKNGVFFNDFKINSLTAAVKKLEKYKIKQVDCQKSAEKFTKEKFIKNIFKIIDENK